MKAVIEIPKGDDRRRHIKPKSSIMKKVYYNKLIRDGIVAKMKKFGVAFEIEKLNKKQYEKALFAKLEEEAGGVLNAKTKKELMYELADILVVIDEIKKFKKIKTAELRGFQKANIQKKGGFSKRLWLVWSEDNGYKTNEKRGKKLKKN
jgi:predicted house-cleaning noncanonical NTP pyrophosphatase (MazG superfamily)